MAHLVKQRVIILSSLEFEMKIIRKKNIPVWIISLPMNFRSKKKYYQIAGIAGDKIIHEHFLGKKILLRCLSSKDHKKTVDGLVDIIKKTGTDRYDPKRKMIFHEFYKKHKPDIFLEECLVTKEKSIMKNILQSFYQKTKGDRKIGLYADIITIYNPRKMKMIKNVYEGQEKSDCFQFRDQKNKPKAILGIIVLKN